MEHSPTTNERLQQRDYSGSREEGANNFCLAHIVLVHADCVREEEGDRERGEEHGDVVLKPSQHFHGRAPMIAVP